MARLNYSYKHSYAVTFTARRDGFSGFSANHKYATFPSVAFAWTATNEPFLKKVSWLDYLKLRLSYGNNGNQAVGRYQSLARMGSDKYVFGNQRITTIYVNSVANNDLTWETTTTKNIGLDFEVLKSRISGSIDVYSSETHGILLRRALPEVTGFKDILTNVGRVHNHGLEMSLHSINLQKGAFRWESALTFSLNRNRIDELTGQGDDIRDGWFIGQPLQSFYGYQTEGIYQLKDTNIPPGFEPGDFRIADTNQDGKITADDRKILGNKLPYYAYSIANTLHFKQLNLYVLINALQGGHGYYLGNNNATRNVNAPFTTFTERFNIQDVPYWTPNRPSEKYPRINYIPPFPHPILEDRSFVRIQDVSLSYHFKKTALERIRLNNLTVYVSAKNLYTFTRWTGYDPENATTIADFPLMRTYTVGIDFSF
jgi:TonB-linked SusC/RagA family outer membrane protein